MICAKFGWNCPSGSGEDENVKSLQVDVQTDGWPSEKLAWEFSSGELKILNFICSL